MSRTVRRLHVAVDDVRGLEVAVDDGDQEHEVLDELVGTTWGNEATREDRKGRVA